MLNIPRFIRKIFKTDNDKELDRLKSLVIQINHNENLNEPVLKTTMTG